MIEVPLVNQPAGALVDDSDAELVSAYRWYRLKPRNIYYAAAYPVPGKGPIYLHRLVLGAGKGERVDHRNGNGLDCQRANLRLATPSQNAANTGPDSTSVTGYRGVSVHQRRGLHQASIVVNGCAQWLGYHPDAWSAAEAYNRAALDAWGEFAWQNVKHP